MISFILVGTLAGLILGLTGSGGTITSTPFLTYGIGIEAHKSLVLAVSLVCCSSLTGLSKPPLLQNIDLKSSFLILAGSCITNPLGVQLSQAMSARFLMLSFGGLILVISFQMLKKSYTHSLANMSENQRVIATPPLEKVYLLISGLGIGLLSGIFGIGGGLIAVPTLNLIACVPMKKAVATALLISLVNSIFSCYNHISASSPPELSQLIPLLLGGAFGAQIGTFIREKISPTQLQLAFSFIIFAMGCSIVVKEFFF